jgi:hypothetical protein
LLTEEAEEEEDRRMDEDSVSFQNKSITLPLEMMISILEFLPTKDLVHQASMVNKAWLAATRNPVLWEPYHPRIGRGTTHGFRISLFSNN